MHSCTSCKRFRDAYREVTRELLQQADQYQQTRLMSDLEGQIVAGEKARHLNERWMDHLNRQHRLNNDAV